MTVRTLPPLTYPGGALTFERTLVMGVVNVTPDSFSDGGVHDSLDAAVAHAARDAKRSGRKEAVVLLSPACASFDQYKNFEVRGAAFRAAVEALEDVQPIGG